MKAVAAVGERLHHGQCLCGAVTYRAAGLADVWYCHCTQCRALTGHYLAACRTDRDKLHITGEVVWAPHSGTSDHGRCAKCGSLLFWSNRQSEHISILPGSLSSSKGIGILGHLYISEKGDYYDITDGLPQYATWPQDD